jgi:hypothetical protein
MERNSGLFRVCPSYILSPTGEEGSNYLMEESYINRGQLWDKPSMEIF